MTSNKRRATTLVGSTILAVAVAACGGATATPETTATVPTASATTTAAPTATATSAATRGPGASLATTGRIELPEHGFAVTLPDGWARVDLSAGDLDAIMEAAGSMNPELADMYSAQIQAMLSSGLALFAFGPGTSGANLNVLVLPGGGLSLDLLEQMNMAQIEALADGAVVSERLQLKAGEALHLRYRMQVAGGVEAPALDQYLVLGGSNQYMFSVTNATEAEAKAIAESIEILD
ncbi:MAG: hypothetical protein M3P84_09255 [Chloroflexota bacterium]|nr:hypothetical protein [Chloroflexota bacterium]